ncbi:hypothetical protein WSM22_12760 [Cytophagales bacterium WSM2-2]|nr:hypothetical protein WSM22_12760 [Cytophagales bacterium WSM2-2]
MKKGLTLLFLFYSLHSLGQNDSTLVNEQATRKNFGYYFGRIPLRQTHRSAKFDIQLDTRNSFVKDFPINVYGVNAGIVLRERFRIGGGYYWINQNFNDKLLGIYATGPLAGRVIVTSKGVPIPVERLDDLVRAGKLNSTDFVSASQQIDLWFASVGFMYTFYVSRLVEFAIPIEIGYGKFSEKLYDNTGNNFATLSASLKPQATTGSFIPGQIGFDILIKPHRWVYFEGSVGYRYTLSQDYTSKYRATSFDSQFDGEYYNIGVKIQLGTIIKEWKAWRKKKTIVPDK